MLWERAAGDGSMHLSMIRRHPGIPPVSAWMEGAKMPPTRLRTLKSIPVEEMAPKYNDLLYIILYITQSDGRSGISVKNLSIFDPLDI